MFKLTFSVQVKTLDGTRSLETRTYKKKPDELDWPEEGRQKGKHKNITCSAYWWWKQEDILQQESTVKLSNDKGCIEMYYLKRLCILMVGVLKKKLDKFCQGDIGMGDSDLVEGNSLKALPRSLRPEVAPVPLWGCANSVSVQNHSPRCEVQFVSSSFKTRKYLWKSSVKLAACWLTHNILQLFNDLSENLH